MDRKFLEGLELDKEVIDKVMAEYGRSINSYKDQLTELEGLKQSHNELNGKYNQLESVLKEKQESIDKLNGQLDSANLKDLKIQVALSNGLPYNLAERLTGTDEDSLVEDAKNLAGYFQTPQSAPLKSTEPSDNDGWAIMAKNL